jgi:hypothetical protein
MEDVDEGKKKEREGREKERKKELLVWLLVI